MRFSVKGAAMFVGAVAISLVALHFLDGATGGKLRAYGAR